jgi:hypothetical protein
MRPKASQADSFGGRRAATRYAARAAAQHVAQSEHLDVAHDPAVAALRRLFLFAPQCDRVRGGYYDAETIPPDLLGEPAAQLR